VRPITVDARRGGKGAATPNSAIDAILGRLSRYEPGEEPA
jgi:hypothetical protein